MPQAAGMGCVARTEAASLWFLPWPGKEEKCKSGWDLNTHTFCSITLLSEHSGDFYICNNLEHIFQRTRTCSPALPPWPFPTLQAPEFSFVSTIKSLIRTHSTTSPPPHIHNLKNNVHKQKTKRLHKRGMTSVFTNQAGKGMIGSPRGGEGEQPPIASKKNTSVIPRVLRVCEQLFCVNSRSQSPCYTAWRCHPSPGPGVNRDDRVNGPPGCREALRPGLVALQSVTRGSSSAALQTGSASACPALRNPRRAGGPGPAAPRPKTGAPRAAPGPAAASPGAVRPSWPSPPPGRTRGRSRTRRRRPSPAPL